MQHKFKTKEQLVSGEIETTYFGSLKQFEITFWYIKSKYHVRFKKYKNSQDFETITWRVFDKYTDARNCVKSGIVVFNPN